MPDADPGQTNAAASLDARIHSCVVERRPRAELARLLHQALDERGAAALLRAVVFPAMADVIARFGAGESVLPFVLQSAELVRSAIDYLAPAVDPSAGYTRGSIVVATLPGDVHDIGKALLIALLTTNGYTVHDLGKQVPVGEIVDAAVDRGADAIGLSALLVSTSRQMPLCIQELDRRGVRLPVLIGGAAINRTFGRRAGILPDGRVYEPGVFYCKDVFEGLAVMDGLTDPDRAADLARQTRAAIEAERELPAQPPPPRSAAPAAALDPPRLADVPRPPFWGARRIAATLPEVWTHLDRNTLFRHHWGGHSARGEAYAGIVRDVFEARLAASRTDALQAGWLEPLIVSGYFPCNAVADELVVFDPRDHDREVARLRFPRQLAGERLCLADYFRPLDGGLRDVVVFQAVSAGSRPGELVDELQRSGEYSRMLYVNGLASATAEALADYANQLARHELGLTAPRGLRFSWGYAACPDLDEQRKVLPLLRADAEIGLTLSPSANLDPEHSTAAMIVHHPDAKYFAVR